MSTQAEALRIAEFFESFRGSSHAIDGQLLHVAAAAELRRLHQRCEELKAVLQECADRLDGVKGGSVSETIAMMRAALSPRTQEPRQ